MYPQDLLATSSHSPTAALHKRSSQQLTLQQDVSDDEQTSPKRFKPSSPTSEMMTPRSPAASRPNMSASHSITLEMLQPHFETPLAQVAKRFGICVTLLKKICRRHGISRWPHRQITGLRKSISSMEHAIGYFEGARREAYAEQLRKQKTKLALLLEDPTKCSPLPAASRFTSHQFPDQASPASASSFPSPQQQPVSRARAFPQSQQLQHQQLFTQPVDHRSHHQFSYPNPGFLPQLHQHLAPQSQQRTQMFHLPPLRSEPRRMLPPIASLVAAANASW